MGAILKRNEIAFPELGEGLFFCFTAANIAALEDKYGEGEYIEKMQINLNFGVSAKTIMFICGLALKTYDGETRKVFPMDWENNEVTLQEFVQPILDALIMSVYGMKYMDFMEEAVKQKALMDEALVDGADKDDEPDPFPGSEVSSESSTTDSDTDLNQTNVGD